mgnify:CR=1 FL=1
MGCASVQSAEATTSLTQGEAVAQRVHRDALVDLRGLGGGVDGAVELARGNRVHRVEPGEEPAARQHPALGMGDPPPDAQSIEE